MVESRKEEKKIHHQRITRQPRAEICSLLRYEYYLRVLLGWHIIIIPWPRRLPVAFVLIEFWIFIRSPLYSFSTLYAARGRAREFSWISRKVSSCFFIRFSCRTTPRQSKIKCDETQPEVNVVMRI